ncbi:MAG: MFS transporter [bacterium]|nr:MFS transporter [bacterium]
MQKKVLPILFVTLLIDTVGIGMIIPIIPIIFTDPNSPSFLLHGYSQSGQYFIAGILTALFGLMQFIASPILGELSDVYGRKRLLTLGVGVLAFSQLLFGFGVEIASLGLLFFSRAVAGFAGANISIAQASIADVTLPQDRAKNFGLIGAAFGVGFILGPLLGGWIAHVTGDAASPFWLAGIFGIINVLFISFFLPETHTEKTERRSFTFLRGIHNIVAAFRDVDARPVYLTSFLYASGFVFFTSFIGILLVSRFALSEASVGTYFGVAGIWMVVTQLFIIRILSGRYRERTILLWSFPVVAFALAVYPFVPRIAFVYVLLPFFAVPQGLSMANLGALVSRGVSSEKQGAALGINSSLFAFSQGVIPLIAGVSSGAIGIQAPFIAGAVLIVFAWVVLFVAAK